MKSFFNILLPPVCYACNIRLENKTLCLCPECRTHLIRQRHRLYGEIEPQNKFFATAVALYFYNYMVRKLLHRFKFRGLRQIGIFFSDKAVEILKEDYPELLSVDATISVPMLKSYERERGFNQATFLCEHISKALNIPNLCGKVIKTAITSKQSLKNLNERLSFDAENSSSTEIYKIKGENPFKDKTILIIDDIFTTGVTVNVLSRFLIQNGAKRVYVFVIAAGNNPNFKRRICRKYAKTKLTSEVF